MNILSELDKYIIEFQPTIHIFLKLIPNLLYRGIFIIIIAKLHYHNKFTKFM